MELILLGLLFSTIIYSYFRITKLKTLLANARRKALIKSTEWR